MKKILFIDGTAGFSPYRLDKKPCGGIITSLTIIPRYLAKNGYDVYVYSAYQENKTVKGVKYVIDVTNINPDIVIFNRNTVKNNSIDIFKNSKKIWWLHDIVDYRYLEDDGYKKVDKIVALSQYCKDSFADFYDINDSKFSIIPNGVDKDIFFKDTTKRKNNLLICASAPIKGLIPLKFTLHNLKRMYPKVEVRIYSSQKLHDFENNKMQDKVLEELEKMGAKICDPIQQKKLGGIMRKAYALLMPNSYPEICSNLMIQAMACGCPVITSSIGSATEFIDNGKNGLMTKTYPHDLHWWIKEYAEITLNLMKDKKLHKKISDNSDKKICSWEMVCLLWKKLMEEI